MENKQESMKKVGESIKVSHEECERLQSVYFNLIKQLHAAESTDIKIKIREKMYLHRSLLTAEIEKLSYLRRQRHNLLLERQLKAF